jgi:hypothetical protein
MSKQVAPTSVQDTQGEVCARHRGNAQILKHDPIKSLDQLIDELIDEVFPTIRHTDHEALQHPHGFATVGPSEKTPGNPPLHDPPFPQDPSIPTRVLNLFLPLTQAGVVEVARVLPDGLKTRPLALVG